MMVTKVEISLRQVIGMCLAWCAIIAIIEYLLGRTADEIVTRLYWLCVGAFGVWYAAWRGKRRESKT